MSSFFQAVEKARKTHPGKPEAVSAWLEPLSVWHIDENEYQEWCYELQTSLVLMEAWQCAGWVDEYLGRTEKAQERYKKPGRSLISPAHSMPWVRILRPGTALSL